MGKRTYQDNYWRVKNDNSNHLTPDQQAEIINKLFQEAERLAYGTASVELKIHAGRCVGVTYSTSENIRQKETFEEPNTVQTITK